jgi:hypothetical protein
MNVMTPLFATSSRTGGGRAAGWSQSGRPGGAVRPPTVLAPGRGKTNPTRPIGTETAHAA